MIGSPGIYRFSLLFCGRSDITPDHSTTECFLVLSFRGVKAQKSRVLLLTLLLPSPCHRNVPRPTNHTSDVLVGVVGVERRLVIPGFPGEPELTDTLPAAQICAKCTLSPVVTLPHTPTHHYRLL